MRVEYNSEGRWLLKFVREICAEEGIELRSLSHGWLMELRKEDQVKRVLGFTFDLNSSIASSIGRDKVATYELLTAYDVPAVPHYIARTSYDFSEAQALFWDKGVVVKPNYGHGGQDIRLFRDATKACGFMDAAREVAWALSPLLDIEREIRVILLDGKVVHVYAKQPAIINSLRVFNLSKGAEPVEHVLTDEQEKLAQQAQKVMQARLCTVDIAELSTGELKVLEINSSISMEQYASYSADNMERAKVVYRQIIMAMFV